MDEHTISPAGDPFHAAARHVDQDGHPGACYEGVVFIGHLVDQDGEEVEVFEAVPCKRCGREGRV